MPLRTRHTLAALAALSLALPGCWLRGARGSGYGQAYGPTDPQPWPTPVGPALAAGQFAAWPLPEVPQPVVLAMGQWVTSIDDVAYRIRLAEPDPFLRVKAIHDFVARWVAYDGQAMFAGYQAPPQDAESVFRRRTAMCDGYVALMLAIGARTGDTLARVAGKSRNERVLTDEMGHAWVRATIGGYHYLIDPTWDAGGVIGPEYRARYSTAYLFTPPDLFANDHLPDDPAQALVSPPLTRAAFEARPLFTAASFAWGYRIEGLWHPVTAVSGGLGFRLYNPQRRWTFVLARPIGNHGRTYSCVAATQAEVIDARCPLTPGRWKLEVQSNTAEGGWYSRVAVLEAESR